MFYLQLEPLSPSPVEQKAACKQSDTSKRHFFVYRLHKLAHKTIRQFLPAIKKCLLVLVLVAYLVYFGYCMHHEFGTEPSIRLLVCTVIGLLLLVRHVWGNTCGSRPVVSCRQLTKYCTCFTSKRTTCIFRW